MYNKKVFYSELAYIFGIITIALGTALLTLADFGVSMIVAPAYLIHLYVSKFLPFFTFGMAEYCFQALLIITLIIVLRKFKLSFLFSFVTAVIYGLLLDGFLFLLSFITFNGDIIRIIYFCLGLIICTFGVSLMFHTYIAPEAYELFVKEISSKLNKNINKVKTIYDISSCIIAIILSFIFFGFGKFFGINIGTIISAIFNGPLIGLFSMILDKNFTFIDYIRK